MTEIPFDLDLLRRYDIAGPRYTSYPTAPQFAPMTGDDHVAAIARSRLAAPDAPLSLYVHVPFCANPCYYCGCTRVITRDARLRARYFDALLSEIDLQGSLFDAKRPIEQLHFGGGTPTSFTDDQLGAVLDRIRGRFGFAPADRREFSIEIDPRTVDAARLERLAAVGFNRISLGVQDFDPDVQSAVNRNQAPELVETLVHQARHLELRSVAFDLIYGLPRQTLEGFGTTLDRVIASLPDRIAIYAYAHLPEMFKAQRQIHRDELPDAALRLRLLQMAIEKLEAVGYVHVGMDHFARPGDELVMALRSKGLHRNFQGYSTRSGLDLLGLGMSGISRIGGAYTQNARGLTGYLDAIAARRPATVRGVGLTKEDELRAAVIEAILCGRDLSYEALGARFGISARHHFRRELAELAGAARDGLVDLRPDGLSVTPRGRHFLRVLAMPFDAYRVAPLPTEAIAPLLHTAA